MVREEGFSSLGRGVGPNVVRAILMNASQLASYVFNSFIPSLSDILDRYDFFKRELLKTSYFEDNMACHITASFGAVSGFPIFYMRNIDVPIPGDRSHNSVLSGRRVEGKLISWT